jgi:RND family efflux transporter MFP subunit
MNEKTVPAELQRSSLIETIRKSSRMVDNKIKTLNIPPLFKNKKVLLGIVAGLILLIIFLLKPSAHVSNIPTFKVKKDKFLITVSESGELRAKNSVSVSAPRIRGNLKIVYLIPEGTYVKTGEAVVKFDPTEALTNLKDAEAKLEIAISEREKVVANHKAEMTRLESDLKSAGLSYELSKLNLEQMKFEAEIKQQEAKLNHQRNELSFIKATQDLESRKIIHQSELNKVEIEAQQKRSDLERAKRDLEMLTLTAPMDGLVVYETNWGTGRKVAIGDTPWSGMTLVSLPDLSTMESMTYVNEVDVSRVRKGLEVLVKLDAFQDSTFKGKISSVASLGKNKDRDSKIKVFEITVEIYSQSEILKPGMTTSNKIIINEISNVIYVPQEAIFEKEGKKIAYVKNGSGFDETKVELGEKSENYVVVTKGLNADDEVALRDPNLVIEDEEGKTDAGSIVQFPGSEPK